MPTPPALLKQRWQTGELVGEAAHALTVRVRQGYMQRGYMDEVRIDTGTAIFPPFINGGHNHHCWQAKWMPTTDWLVLPNIESAKWTRDFTQKGISSLTVVMDNVNFEDIEGVAGLYHDIQRGYFSPMRGVRALSRPSLWDTNSWQDALNGGYQVELWEGYGQGAEVAPGGDAVSRTWTGIIENCELESFPDHVTITARDFGVFFTDQRLMGWNKAREIRAPITFADHKWVSGERRQVGGLSSSSGGQPSINDSSGAVLWTSGSNAAANDTEWIESTLVSGHYKDFFLAPKFDGMEAFLSIKVGPGGGVMDRVHPIAEGWVDTGLGTVPGTTIPYVRNWAGLSQWPRRWGMGHQFDLPDNSIIRVTFTKLHKSPRLGGYRAGVDNFYALRYAGDPEKVLGTSNRQHWILVDDVADIIRMLCIWAGFKEWHVEDFGWSLAKPMQFGEDKFLMDVIDEILTQGNYVFYMAAPTSNDESIGVPHFEHQSATNKPMPGMVELRDTDMLEKSDVKWDLSNLPYVLRYRGEVSPTGHTLERDLVKRFMATYFPPWAGGLDYFRLDGRSIHLYHTPPRVAGLRRHFQATLGFQTTIGLQSDVECLFACILAAIQYALGMATMEVQIAGLPAFELNQQVSVVDEGTGANSRLWAATIESDHQMGPQGKWEMKIGGSMIDTEDLFYIAKDYAWAYANMGKLRPPTGEDRQVPVPLVDPQELEPSHDIQEPE